MGEGEREKEGKRAERREREKLRMGGRVVLRQMRLEQRLLIIKGFVNLGVLVAQSILYPQWKLNTC